VQFSRHVSEWRFHSTDRTSVAHQAAETGEADLVASIAKADVLATDSANSLSVEVRT
jgi:hypothetical protein